MDEPARTSEPHQVEEEHENDYHDIKTLLSWSAPGRPFRKKGREFYASMLLILLLVEIILFLFSEYQLMLAAAALAFLSIVLSTVPPRDFHYKVTSEGIKVEDHFYIWGELYDFYFKRIENMPTLIVRTEALFPGELKISLGGISQDHMRRVLISFLPYREIVKPTFMEKSGDWLARNFPLEKSRKES